MKNTFLALCFIVSTLQISYGQFSLGLEGGLNFSKIKYEGPYDFRKGSGSTNYFISLAPKYSFTPKLSLITDISYINKGYKFRCTNGKCIYRTSYLNIAPQIEYKVQKYLGIGLGFYGGSKLKEQFKNPDKDWYETAGIFKSLDLGLIGSIRVYYKNVYLKLAYEHGLTNITNSIFTDDEGQIIDRKIHNRGIQIGLGYSISLTKKYSPKTS